MATQRQKKLAKALVENAVAEKPITAKELLVNVGYAINTAEVKPKEIIEQKGVQEELVAMGFTEDNAKLVVSEIMLNPSAEDNNRLKAADMVFKVKGGYAAEKSINLNVELIDEELIKEIADELNVKIKDVHQGANFSSNGTISSTVVKEVQDENGKGDST